MKSLILSFTLIPFLVVSLYAQEEGIDSQQKPIENQSESFREEEANENSSFTLDPMQDRDSQVKESAEEENIDEVPDRPLNQNEEIVYTDKTDDIQTLNRGGFHNGFFGGITFKATEFNNKDLVMMGIRGGWIANRAIAFGFEGYGLIPSAEYSQIDSYYNARAVGGYGGLFIEPILFSNKLVHVTFPISSGAGWLGYVYDWEDSYRYDSELIDGDVFWYIEPGAGVEINVTKAFRLHMGGSYRLTQDLNLVQTSEKAFTGWNYFLTFKFGRF